MTRAQSLTCLAAATLLGACDAQVTSEYRGEPMVSIRGNIVADTPPGAAEAALLWWTGPGTDLVTPVTTEGSFPSAFTLSVYRRAPEAALFDVAASAGAVSTPGFPGERMACRLPAGLGFAPAGGRLAIATVAAVGRGGSGGLLGLAAGVALVFVSSGTAIAPGYHLMRVEQRAEPGAGVLECRGCAASGVCDGPATFLELREDEEGLQGTEIEIRIRAG
jgi:hypothetical protein